MVVIFGATGDLAQRKLYPALLNLWRKKLLPENLRVVGFSRREIPDSEFRKFVSSSLESAGEKPDEFFLSKFHYVQGYFDQKQGYKKLSDCLAEIDWNQFGHCSNKLFYLAVPPAFYSGIFERLSESGLTIPCGGEKGWTRVLVEKPFGRDEETAAKLDKELGNLFAEKQIFRIDHYLAKETLQNILAFRFANAIFEPVWNSNFIDSVEISLFESQTAKGRADTYDMMGTLRDVGQNHILQMLSLVAMERPASFDAEGIRIERAKVFKLLEKIREKEIAVRAVRGQYEGYLGEEDVAPNSQTETFFFIKTFVENGRWKNVPFFLSSGKALGKSEASIKINFKSESGFKISEGSDSEGVKGNSLIFRIQPDEGISVVFFAKVFGFENKIEPRKLSFRYADSSDSEKMPDAYQRVLFDCVKGDQTLFASTEEVAGQWKFITPILRSWEKLPLHIYKKGSDGPDVSDIRKAPEKK